MRLPFLRPKSDVDVAERFTAGGSEAGSMQLARTQARRRLMGALVLLVAAVVGFPLLFETQPRPLPGPVPIENKPLLTRDAAPAVDQLGADRPKAAPAASAALATPALPAKVAVAASAVAPAGAASSAVTPPKPTVEVTKPAKSEKADKADKVEKPAVAPPVAPTASASAASASAVPKPAEAPAADATAARWVVQVGAYNDMERMRQARQKAEKLGFKTYTTEVDTPTGRRTRVRLGPFGSQKEADAAAVKVKAAGMAANVLSL